jgi:hypothetical protein
VFVVNEAYGNAAVLRSYCNVSQKTPIWGEIQHSLWVNAEKKSQELRSRLFPKIFTWNEILKIQGSLPIGDPILYLPKHFQSCEPMQGNKIIGLPKFRRNENLQSRIQIYKEFLSYTLEFVSNESFILVLHPGELKYADEIRGKKFRDVQIYLPPTSHQPMEDYFRLLSRSGLVVSDYLGPHAFRSSYFFETEVHLTPEIWRNPVEEPRISELFDAYVRDSSKINRKLISQQLLGVDSFKSVNELRKILGFSFPKKSLGPAIKWAYELKNSF